MTHGSHPTAADGVINEISNQAEDSCKNFAN
jgi:hypothetical protein